MGDGDEEVVELVEDVEDAPAAIALPAAIRWSDLQKQSSPSMASSVSPPMASCVWEAAVQTFIHTRQPRG